MTWHSVLREIFACNKHMTRMIPIEALEVLALAACVVQLAGGRAWSKDNDGSPLRGVRADAAVNRRRRASTYGRGGTYVSPYFAKIRTMVRSAMMRSMASLRRSEERRVGKEGGSR